MTDLIDESPSKEKMEGYWRRAKACKNVEEILSKDGPLSFLFKDTIENLLQEEMTDHLGHEHNDARAKEKIQTTDSNHDTTIAPFISLPPCLSKVKCDPSITAIFPPSSTQDQCRSMDRGKIIEQKLGLARPVSKQFLQRRRLRLRPILRFKLW